LGPFGDYRPTGVDFPDHPMVQGGPSMGRFTVGTLSALGMICYRIQL
jgi:hypothetical protein